MKLLEVRKYLYDIRQAGLLLQQFVAGKALEDYIGDALLRSAVERQFGIIGEALSKAIQIDPGLSEHIINTRRIIGFRNRLIHGYTSIDNEVVWGIVESNIDALVQQVSSLLDQPDDDGTSN